MPLPTAAATAGHLIRTLAVPAPAGLVLLVDVGDLHYGNVLAGTRQPWLAIDPKPFAGHPERSVAELLWTRLDEAVDDASIRALLATIVESGQLEPERAHAWAVLRATSYWLWGLENGLTEDPVRCSRLLEALLPIGKS